MERASFAKMECPIARAADEVGDAWTLLILREAYKGASTFGDFEAGLPITPTTLARRLDALAARQFFTRAPYQTNPPRHRYVLTEKARELLPILLALGAWGNRWLAPEGELLTPIDADSGRPIDLAIVDRKTNRALRAGHVALRAGRGASKRVRDALQKPLVLG